MFTASKLLPASPFILSPSCGIPSLMGAGPSWLVCGLPLRERVGLGGSVGPLGFPAELGPDAAEVLGLSNWKLKSLLL